MEDPARRQVDGGALAVDDVDEGPRGGERTDSFCGEPKLVPEPAGIRHGYDEQRRAVTRELIGQRTALANRTPQFTRLGFEVSPS